MLQNYSALLTDFYQLTMAYGYWRLGMQDQEAVFHLIFRSSPFKGKYTLNCGLATVIEYLQNWHFSADDIAYLATLRNVRDEQIFPVEFLDYLANLRFTGDLDAIPEGTVVFAQEPLLRIQGPLLQCQLLETPLLNILNFQTLIATKAARVCQVAAGDPVIEFGMRRAQGPDGALSASRAAYIGGCTATSNTLAGKLYGIPVRGTHAHSWVTAFTNEQEAFSAYAEVLPHNCMLLVDTFDTISGVQHAIEVGHHLREQGADLLGIRLDSGDMADLSIKARKLLDAAGFQQTQILASNKLDEYVMQSIKQQGAKIGAWGVGTNMVTAYDQPALDMVYKLSALRSKDGRWIYKLKLSEQAIKISNPGRMQVRRFFYNDQYVMDVLYDLELGISEMPEMVSIDQAAAKMKLADYDAFVDLLKPIFKQGKLVEAIEPIQTIRQRAIEDVAEFYQMHDDHVYPVGMEMKLYELKQQLIAELKKL